MVRLVPTAHVDQSFAGVNPSRSVAAIRRHSGIVSAAGISPAQWSEMADAAAKLVEVAGRVAASTGDTDASAIRDGAVAVLAACRAQAAG